MIRMPHMICQNHFMIKTFGISPTDNFAGLLLKQPKDVTHMKIFSTTIMLSIFSLEANNENIFQYIFSAIYWALVCFVF